MYGRYALKLSNPRTIRVVSTSSAFCVSLEEAKHHIRVEHTEDDTYITSLIEAAERYCEIAIDRTFMQKRLEATWDGFLPEIVLPRPPIRVVPNVVISYIDGTQNAVTLADSDFRIETNDPSILRPPYSETWPTALADISSVTVSWNAGYESADDVPQGLKHAVLMLLGHLYERRLAYDTLNSIEVPLGVKALLSANSWGQYR